MTVPVTGRVTSTGDYIHVGETEPRDLPPKRWREHRWIAVAAFVLSDEQAEASVTPGNQVLMDGSNLFHCAVGCYDCEQPYQLAKDGRCRVATAPRGRSDA